MNKRYRDAQTGQYVSEAFAKKHPKTTVSESTRSNKSGKSSKRK
ncbi:MULTISPECIES: multidrug transporter [Legionella]|uniref:Multidrug transporter n=1 Tax=Legionella quinlivanii TaxID=45073 RepID=A0A364LIM0_9GAMM|nr:MULTISPECIES: multidrug transporter [Legionella]MCE3043726.1 multidrug transporter [Legionella sp. 16cNR16C]RAP36224.1 multidrug transporter [Legionella quinlivanii]